MTIITTKKNRVQVLTPTKGDGIVLTYLAGLDGREVLTTHHIDDFQVAVDWAVQVADGMAYPICIVPTKAAGQPEGERLRLRQAAVATMLDTAGDDAAALKVLFRLMEVAA